MRPITSTRFCFIGAKITKPIKSYTFFSKKFFRSHKIYKFANECSNHLIAPTGIEFYESSLLVGKRETKEKPIMKKVLFMFVAVLALVSCQKSAEKASEAAPADSAAQTEAVQQEEPKAAEELKAPEKTGDAVADAKAMAEYIKAKIKATKTIEELTALEQDPVFADFQKVCENATPEIEKIAAEIEPAMEEQMKAIMLK
ncbi:MAG: hypothetical protein ACI30R_05075 [Sodaliphilus sp.]